MLWARADHAADRRDDAAGEQRHALARPGQTAAEPDPALAFRGEEFENQQEGLRFSFESSSLAREAGLAALAVMLPDLHETWLHPSSREPSGDWVVHLGRLSKRFDLKDQAWLSGSRVTGPQFDEVERNGRRLGVVRFAIPMQAEVDNSTWWRRFVESSEVKPGWFGFAIDLKALFRRRRSGG